MLTTTSHLFCILFLLYFYECHYGTECVLHNNGIINQDFLMPDVRLTEPDEYICTAIPVTQRNVYIVNVVPRANTDAVQHMTLLGLAAIEEHPNNAWKCRFMEFELESQYLFAWARNGPTPTIPRGKLPAKTHQ
ncbi:peptidyl-glycine alpha-amidating monooxygenase B-like [Anneissia japonica]|uniref:peptidyl-glycine alpha-amidating monooxygenase B-like n=1 Tax=Anneissia japonica TaxID=1529436 RepID=UPI00142586C3|nr:peptidyl-glycine alpha-amidating monooxygenase B-like [Anneissia japonica]